MRGPVFFVPHLFFLSLFVFVSLAVADENALDTESGGGGKGGREYKEKPPSNAATCSEHGPRQRGKPGGLCSGRIVMTEITLEVQGRCGDLVKLQVTMDTTPMLRLTLPALGPAELSSPAASFLRLNRDPANNVLHFLSPDDWLELESTSRGGRIAVAGSACWRREVGGKVAYLARRRALFRVSRAFQVSLDGSM